MVFYVRRAVALVNIRFALFAALKLDRFIDRFNIFADNNSRFFPVKLNVVNPALFFLFGRYAINACALLFRVERGAVSRALWFGRRFRR
jgi:hypothetical protein